MDLNSAAFSRAAADSEIRRSCIVAALALLFVAILGRAGLARDMHRDIAITGAIGLGSLAALQGLALAIARRAKRLNTAIPLWFTTLVVAVESSIPTAILFANIKLGAMAPYTALSAPPVLAYGLMISLTTLRLRPWLCVAAGGLAAMEYAGLLTYVVLELGISRPTTGLTRSAYFNSTVIILASGIAAAWVAWEIRRHLMAALREAETDRRNRELERDMETARSIQQALLPREEPQIDGFEVAGWNRPADQTGGDYYDWQRMPDGTWMVTLADVSGHGIGPAMVTAACRAYVRAAGMYHGDLGSLTSRINGLLADDLPAGRFVTMVSVLLRPGRGDLSLLSAGHGPIVLYAGTTGGVRDVMPQSMPLAIDREERYGPPDAVDLQPGDVLALVTDGIVEWSRFDGGRREAFGNDRLRDALRRHAERTPSQIIEAIVAEATEFARGERQQDDLTMVVIKRTAGGVPRPVS